MSVSRAKPYFWMSPHLVVGSRCSMMEEAVALVQCAVRVHGTTSESKCEVVW